MKQFTIKEKETLLIALDHHIDDLRRAKEKFAADEAGEIMLRVWELQELKAKLILNITPITIEKEETNADASICCLCGNHFYLNKTEQAIITGYGNVCDNCLKKYEPELFEKTQKSNKGDCPFCGNPFKPDDTHLDPFCDKCRENFNAAHIAI